MARPPLLVGDQQQQVRRASFHRGPTLFALCDRGRVDRDSARLVVLDRGEAIEFGFDDLLRHHGGGSPGGVALAFKALERGLPLIAPDAPPERREVVVHTAFGGPGARDAFECVLGTVTGERYVVDHALERPDLPPTRARFVFRLG